MRQLHHGIETLFNEKLIYNPFNAKLWFKLRNTAFFRASLKVFAQIFSRLNFYRLSDYQLYAIPLSHLDAAWLWTAKDSVFRAYKTFKMAIEHIQRYPFFKISLTTPHYFQWIKHYDRYLPSPDSKKSLWQATCEAVASGKIDLCGGCWVEPDLNVPCGEALVRQRLYGQLFYLRHFGKMAPISTLLDVFGYPNTFPQILQKSGAKAFWTTKLTWNDYSMWPFANFFWEGLDGTRIFTHQFKFNLMSLLDLGRYRPMARRPKQKEQVYNSHTIKDAEDRSQLNFSGINLATQNYSGLSELHDDFSEDYVKTLGIFYGLGDGGKGPLTSEIDFMATLGQSFHIPHVTTSKYFDILRQDAGDQLPIWNDEMYLEYHRGTLTTQVKVKQGNQQCEYWILAAERLWTILLLTEKIPFDEKTSRMFTECWQRLLFNQFHDILPGSSIPEVYLQTWKDHQRILKKMKGFITKTLQTVTQSQQISVFNPNPFSNYAYLSSSHGKLRLGPFAPYSLTEIDVPKNEKNNITPSHASEIIVDRIGLAYIVKTPSLCCVFDTQDGALKGVYVKLPLKNRWVSILYGSRNGFPILESTFPTECTSQSQLDSYLKNHIQQVLQRKGVHLQAFREIFTGNPYPAWNICKNFTQNPLEIQFLDFTPIQHTSNSLELQTRYQVLNSRITIKIRIFTPEMELHFATSVDLADEEILLKHFIPMNIKSEDVVCESQFGNVTRTKHPHTKMEAAKWEFSHHTWLDESDEDYGVALIAPDRYGASANSVGVGLTLVRSPPYPTDLFYTHEMCFSQGDRPKHTDIMKHDFKYVLHPHERAWDEAHIPWVAHQYSSPCLIIDPKSSNNPSIPPLALPQKTISFPSFQISPKNLILTAMKPTEWNLNPDHLESNENSRLNATKWKLSSKKEKWVWERNYVIIRIYEAEGRTTQGLISLENFLEERTILSVEEIDLLERPLKVIDSHTKDRIMFSIKPYEIKSFRLKLN